MDVGVCKGCGGKWLFELMYAILSDDMCKSDETRDRCREKDGDTETMIFIKVLGNKYTFCMI